MFQVKNRKGGCMLHFKSGFGTITLQGHGSNWRLFSATTEKKQNKSLKMKLNIYIE